MEPPWPASPKNHPASEPAPIDSREGATHPESSHRRRYQSPRSESSFDYHPQVVLSAKKPSTFSTQQIREIKADADSWQLLRLRLVRLERLLKKVFQQGSD